MRTLAIGLVSLLLASVTLAQPATPDAASISGSLDDGTQWAVVRPAAWNGTLVLDLDGAGIVNGARGFNAWLLESGYAYGGINRGPVGYDFPQAVDHLVYVREQAAEAWGAPVRTLITGSSRGAFAGRKALELRPDIFDGGLVSAGGGAGEIAVLNNKLNAVFVLKTLVDPDSAMTLVNIDAQTESKALNALVDLAGSTAAGRARLALASAIVQMPLWTNGRAPRPAPDDYAAQLEQMRSSWSFAIAIPVRAAIEELAGGNVSWNTDVDYARLLADSGREAMTRYFYAEAGISLDEDLRILAQAPRIAADPAAVARAEGLMTYTGAISDPLVNVDNDDPVDPMSDKIAYRDLLVETGSDHLFRILWSERPGHGGMSSLDRAVGFSLLIDYLDSGEWDDTSLPALRARAAAIAAGTEVDLGDDYLYQPADIPPYASTWDASDWGSYRAD